MKELIPESLKARLEQARIMAVVVIDDIEDTIPVMKALTEGGINAIELALRTPASIEAVRIIKKEFPSVILGVGTVLSVDQVDAIKGYADLIVTPGFNRRIVQKATDEGIPIAPGISSPSDIEAAAEMGCRVLKLFPAENLGGIPYLNAISTPYAHLGLSYIPLGGVNKANCKEYSDHPKVLCIGGSWIAPRKLISSKQWDEITRNAHEAMQALGKGENS